MPRGTPFQKGNPGRPVGSTNHLTKTVKDTVLAVFNDLQAHPKANLMEFAKENPKEFYQIAAKLIPTEVQAQVTSKVVKVIRADRGNTDSTPDTAS